MPFQHFLKRLASVSPPSRLQAMVFMLVTIYRSVLGLDLMKGKRYQWKMGWKWQVKEMLRFYGRLALRGYLFNLNLVDTKITVLIYYRKTILPCFSNPW